MADYKEVSKDVINLVCEAMMIGNKTDEELEEDIAFLIQANQLSKIWHLEKELARYKTIVSN